MEVLGFTISVLMGISLGLLGGGGSIFTVPVLVYVFGINATLSSIYSNFTVGLIAGIGFYNYSLRKLIDFRCAFSFLLPALISIFYCKEYLVPALPDAFSFFDLIGISKSSLILLMTGILMLIASGFMLKEKETQTTPSSTKNGSVLLSCSGLVIGGLTAFIGIGGGFLIVPALVVFGHLPMKKAIGTTLFIILIKSCTGFIIDLNQYSLDWFFLIKFSTAGILGLLTGIYLSDLVSNDKLKRSFAYLIGVVGCMVLIKELFFPPFNI